MTDMHLERIGHQYLRTVIRGSLELLNSVRRPLTLKIYKRPLEDEVVYSLMRKTTLEEDGAKGKIQYRIQMLREGKIVSDAESKKPHLPLEHTSIHSKIVNDFRGYTDLLTNGLWLFDEFYSKQGRMPNNLLLRVDGKAIGMVLYQIKIEPDYHAAFRNVHNRMELLRDFARLAAETVPLCAGKVDLSDDAQVLRFAISYIDELPNPDDPPELQELGREIGSFEPLLEEHDSSLFNIVELTRIDDRVWAGLEHIDEKWSFNMPFDRSSP